MDTGSIGRTTFGGLASGLDTNALLNGLLELERIPLDRLRSRQSEIETQRGLMRQLNTKLLALRKAAQALDNRNSTGNADSLDEEFLRYSGSSTDEDVVGVTAGAGAAPGEIEVEVKQLARGSRFFSESYASDTATVLTEGQFFRISLPNGDPDAVPPKEPTTIRVEATADSGPLSLQDMRDQINTSPDNGGTVRADILKIAEGDYQLVVKTTGTGLSNQMNLGGNMLIQAPDPERDFALNAEFYLFGLGSAATDDVPIERESNVVDDVLSGVTLRLNRVAREDENAPGVPIPETVTVDVDVEEIAKGIETFTEAYNDVVDFLDAQFRYDEVNNQSGPLSGDFTLRRVQGQLRSMISRGFAFSTNPSNPFAPGGDSGAGGAISNIGIEVESGGRLRLDKSKLEEALALDPLSVREFLKGRAAADDGDDETVDYDPGFADLVATQLEELVRSGDGLLASRDQAFADRIAEFDVSIERFEFRLGQREETLIARFTELERIVSGLQSQQGFLAGIG